jgi:hypothetical protein
MAIKKLGQFSEGCMFRTGELSSALTFRLKQTSRSFPWFSPVLLGFVDITIEQLLDQCKNNQRELVVFAQCLVAQSNFRLLQQLR